MAKCDSAHFDNLLPESERIRRRLSVRFKTGSTEAFELLQAIGRDCVGAVQLLPPDLEPEGFDHLDYDVLKSADVERILEGVTAPAGPVMADGDDGFRISIAGAQETTALLAWEKKWCRCAAPRPPRTS